MSRNVLTPDALTMMDAIARTGSFAAAAREMGKVPSALTYNVRQLEDALDVLLFDRRSRQARLTAAGEELLNEGRRLLEQMDAVANRVKRVATGWETQLTIAVDGILSRVTMFELCEAFFSHSPDALSAVAESAKPVRTGPPTRLRLRNEVLAGTWEALVSGQADLAIGVGMGSNRAEAPGIRVEPLGEVAFVFAVAPHHPLASVQGPISDAQLLRHRAVAVADSAQRLAPVTVNLLPGQDVGCGFLPEPVAREHIAAGRLVVKSTQRQQPLARMGYAWRTPGTATPAAKRKAEVGLALSWWLAQLDSPATRKALLERHASAMPWTNA